MRLNEGNERRFAMPMGKGTYGTKVGRPLAKNGKKKKKKIMKKQLDICIKVWYNTYIYITVLRGKQ